MQLDRGPMRAAPPSTEPDGQQAGWPRRRARLIAAAIAALALFSGAAPAAADSIEPAAAPSVSIELLACDLLGASDIVVSISGLSTGTYTASVSSDGSTVAGATVTAASGAILFPDLPNGATYLVSVDDAHGSTVASATASLPVCDLPTLGDDDPVVREAPGAAAHEETLAATGLAVDSILMLALGALLAGAVAVTAGLVRRRA